MINDTLAQRLKRAGITVCVTLAVAGVWAFAVGAVFSFVFEIRDSGLIGLAMTLSIFPFSIFLAPKVWQATAGQIDAKAP